MGIFLALNENGSIVTEGFGKKLPPDVEKMKEKLKANVARIELKDSIRGARFDVGSASSMVAELVKTAGGQPLCTSVDHTGSITGDKLFCIAICKDYLVKVSFIAPGATTISFTSISVIANMKSGTNLNKGEIAFILAAINGLSFSNVTVNKNSIGVHCKLASINPSAADALGSKVAKFNMAVALTNNDHTMTISKVN